MLIVVGLGNPEKKYQNTHHNIGFMVLDEAAQRLFPHQGTSWRHERGLKCQMMAGRNFVLAKSQVAMNLSGVAVAKLVHHFASLWGMDSLPLLVVHDDLDLPLGQMRIAKKRGSAGHHGVDSIIDNLGNNNFWRLRIGIGHPEYKEEKRREVIDYVLSPFLRREERKLEQVVGKASDLVVRAVRKGAEEMKGKYEV